VSLRGPGKARGEKFGPITKFGQMSDEQHRSGARKGPSLWVSIQQVQLLRYEAWQHRSGEPCGLLFRARSAVRSIVMRRVTRNGAYCDASWALPKPHRIAACAMAPHFDALHLHLLDRNADAIDLIRSSL